MEDISYVIWIDPNIDNKINIQYQKELKAMSYLKLQCFNNIDDALIYIKTLKFIETKIIISGKLYIQFINLFIKNIKFINVIPKIIIFTSNKNLFIENNINHKNIINHSFYNFGGIKTTFDEIIQISLQKGETETLYLDLESFTKLKMAVVLTDEDQKINFDLSGPNSHGRTSVL
jgi:hypothetical protein